MPCPELGTAGQTAGRTDSRGSACTGRAGQTVRAQVRQDRRTGRVCLHPPGRVDRQPGLRTDRQGLSASTGQDGWTDRAQARQDRQGLSASAGQDGWTARAQDRLTDRICLHPPGRMDRQPGLRSGRTDGQGLFVCLHPPGRMDRQSGLRPGRTDRQTGRAGP